VLQRISLDDIIKNLKVGKGKYQIDYKYSVFVKGNKALARDAAFLLVCQMIRGEFNDPDKDSIKVFNAVKYIVSHLAIFRYPTRQVVRAAYEDSFHASVKQSAELNRWPVSRPGEGVEDDVTTEESSSDLIDVDD
jgi:hypothetical protein